MKDNRSVYPVPALAGVLRVAGLLIASTAILSVGGCYDVGTDLDRLPQRPVRPAPVPLAPASRPAQPVAVQPAAASQPVKREERKKAAKPTEPVVEVGVEPRSSYQQVVLLSEPTPPETPPGLRYVPLKQAPAQEVGGVLSWLYPPAGPAGSRDRYSLLYPSALEADAVVQAAADLDVPPVKDEASAAKPATGAEAWALGVGLLFRTTPNDRLPRERYQRAEAALAQALADTKVAPERRWAAGMIAGAVAAEQLRDLDAAKRHFAAAEGLSQPGSLERMATWLAQAGVHTQNGEPRSAQRLLGRILTEFPLLRDTEVFDRATRAKADLDRNR